MNTIISTLCLVFSLACHTPSIQQDGGGSGGGSGSGSGDGAGGVVAVATGSSGGAQAFQQITASNDDGSLMLAMHGAGKVTAIVNGELVPRERIVRDGDHLRVNDADGRTLFDIRVLPGGGLAYPYDAARSWAYVNASDPEALERLAVLTTGNGKPRKMIGVTTVPVEPALASQLGVDADETIVVTEVAPDMPAGKAGLQVHDIVQKIDGTGPATTERLREIIRSKDPGQELPLSILRKGQPLELSVAVEEVTAERLAGAWPDAGGLWTTALGGDPGAWDSAAYRGDLLAQAYATAADRGTELADAQDRLRAEQEEIRAHLEDVKRQAEQVAQGSGREPLQQAQAALEAALERLAATADSLAEQASAHASEPGFVSGSDGSRALLLPSRVSPGAYTIGVKDMTERVVQMEERLKRLEELLQRLVDGTGKAAPPAPSETPR